MKGPQELTNALLNHPRPAMAPLPRDGGLQLSYLLISGAGKATDFKFSGYIHRANPNKSPLKIQEKMECGRIQGLPKFFGYPLFSQERVKLRTSNIVGTFIGSIGTKAHEKCQEQQPRAYRQSGSPINFQGTHVQGALHGHLCDSTAFLYYCMMLSAKQSVVLPCQDFPPVSYCGMPCISLMPCSLLVFTCECDVTTCLPVAAAADTSACCQGLSASLQTSCATLLLLAC